mgnify:CR=1 FL=1
MIFIICLVLSSFHQKEVNKRIIISSTNYKKNNKLKSLLKGYAQRFTLYSGQAQRNLTDVQQEIMRQIAEYIITDGAFTPTELNGFDTELWKKAIPAFGSVKALETEIIDLSKFMLKAA